MSMPRAPMARVTVLSALSFMFPPAPWAHTKTVE
jgi:hypothetical protein